MKSFMMNRLHFLKIQELDLTNGVVKEFNEIYDSYILNGNGDMLNLPLTVSKYIFLNYLIEHKNILVHGSNHSHIGVFEPREQTLFNGKKVKAVFASSDGNWSIFFAVINREEYVGSLRNMCLTVKTKKGIKRYYYFSLNKEYEDGPWRNGTIYLLPKDEFKQGGIKDEWICEHEVRPLAKLSVTPDDFIFKNDVKRHNEASSPIVSMVKALIFNS